MSDDAAEDDDGAEPLTTLFGDVPPPSTRRSPKDGKSPSAHPNLDWTPGEIDADPKFREFWEAYPSIKGKGKGRSVWLRVIRSGVSPDALTAGALAYRSDPRRTAHFTKHASTWLNDECWGDYAEPVAVGVAERNGNNQWSGGNSRRYETFKNPEPSAYDLPL